MDKKTKIVIIDLKKDSFSVIEKILKKIGGIDIISETHDPSKGLDLVRKNQPDIVILHLYPSEEVTLGLAKKISQGCPESVLIVLSEKKDSDLVINSMRAGAREFINQPYNDDELVHAITRAINTKKRISAEKGLEGKVITVFGVKGGVGTTTIVSNISTALAAKWKKETIVLDLNFQFGNASIFLDIKTKYSILEIANNIDNIDVSLLKSKLPKNSNGITMMSGPPKIEDAETISCKNIEDIVIFFKNIFDYIIIDTNHSFDDITLKSLDVADTILMISKLDVPTIYNTRRCLDVFKRIGYGNDKVKLILNSYTSSYSVDMKAMEKLIENPIFWRLPDSSSKTLEDSINKGIPIIEMMPNSNLSKNYIKMVSSLNGIDNQNIHEEESVKDKKVALFKKKRK